MSKPTPDRRRFPSERLSELADRFENATRRERWLSVLVLFVIHVFVVAMLIRAYPHAIQFGADPAPATQQREAGAEPGSGR